VVDTPPLKRHPVRSYLIGCLATVLVIVLVGVVFIVVKVLIDEEETREQQSALAPFYRPPSGWQDTTPGTVLRKERVGGAPAGGRGWRILYRTERADGSAAVSGGLVFAPRGAAPPGARPVVAWAHPTVGMGAQCAPSRTPEVEKDVQGLALFLREGWVVTATDYAGLGTRGTLQYLVGAAEARDVVNSVRAAQQMGIGAGTRVALWGHSQGGHAVLWTQALAPGLAPEVEIVGTAAAAPAAELAVLFSHQWDDVYGSLIGSETLVAWPYTYRDVRAGAVTDQSEDTYRGIADHCLIAGLIDAEIRDLIGEQLFSENPVRAPAWRAAAIRNTPPAPSPSSPTFVVQGLADPIVLPGSTATFATRACAAGSDLTTLWIGDLGHAKAGAAAAPSVFTWFQERFAGAPATTTCGTSLPVRPLDVAR
jgi:pimeloyl-ACP methyl ester carboxylesterase